MESAETAVRLSLFVRVNENDSLTPYTAFYTQGQLARLVCYRSLFTEA